MVRAGSDRNPQKGVNGKRSRRPVSSKGCYILDFAGCLNGVVVERPREAIKKNWLKRKEGGGGRGERFPFGDMDMGGARLAELDWERT
jgi:hypothetical protein